MNAIQTNHLARSPKDAPTHYDRMSRWYDLFAVFENQYRDAGLRMLDVKQDERVLEIGFGTGYSIVALAQSVGVMGRVYGIDLSSEMCRITQARVRAAKLTSRVNLQRGDATNLPLDRHGFDAIFMSFALELFNSSEIQIVLAECYRVLHQAGRIGLVVMAQQEKLTWPLRFYLWAHRTFPAFVDCRPIFVQRTLEEAKFRIVRAAQVSVWGLPGEIVVAIKEAAEVKQNDSGKHSSTAASDSTRQNNL